MSTSGGLMDFFPTNFILQASHDNDDEAPSSRSSVLPICTPQDFHGIAPMLGKRSIPFSGIDVFHEEANGGCGGGIGEEEDNLSDEGSQLWEKKRRLNMVQVKTLEKNFELGNKLEPERKSQLAKALGLQPRQIAIWFQNRRARWKAKQLEKDYVILKRQFESLKADNQSLLAQNHKLQSEISTCKGREPTESINLNKEMDQGSCSNKSENSSDIKLDISTRTPITGSRAFFPPPANRPAARPFQNPPPAQSDIHCQKFDHIVREEGLTNMFCGIDDQSGFWPWIEQPNFS